MIRSVIRVTLVGFLLLFTWAMAYSEAEQLALESSGELLPAPQLVQRIQQDLQAIRQKFPVVSNLHHVGKWQPGQLLLFNVNNDTLRALTTSQFAPAELKPIFQDSIYLATFSQPYNPERLADVLMRQFGVGAEPNGGVGDGDRISYMAGPGEKNTYVFSKGWGDCPSGCIHRHFWKFTAGPGANCAELLEEGGDDLSGSAL